MTCVRIFKSGSDWITSESQELVKNYSKTSRGVIWCLARSPEYDQQNVVLELVTDFTLGFEFAGICDFLRMPPTLP